MFRISHKNTGLVFKVLDIQRSQSYDILLIANSNTKELIYITSDDLLRDYKYFGD